MQKIYVTDDNPRNESPKKIRKEIIRNIKNRNVFNIGDRTKAIKTAILNADPNEIILIAGKGHESKQIYKNKIILKSDKNIVKNLKLKVKKISIKDKNFLYNKKIFKEIKKDKKLKNFHGLSIDTRSIKKDNLFLTFKGKKNNGFKFIDSAIKKGAAHIISSKKIKSIKRGITVENEIKFLNNFAKLKRSYTSAKILAVTGSAGKTSLKNLINGLLQNYGKSFCSPRSFNNHLGVPLSLSNLKLNHNFGVFEVGISKSGEINKLSKLIRPHVAIITNVGEAHIENFNSLNGIAAAKGEIISNIEKNGLLILNRDNKYFNYFSKRAKTKKLNVISFGMNKNSDIYPLNIKKDKIFTKIYVKINKQVLNFKFKNINIYNVLSSLALLKGLKLNLSKVTKFYSKYEAMKGGVKYIKLIDIRKILN